jgi:hypothetical protein
MATRDEFDINEDSHGKLTFLLEDEDGDPVLSADIDSIVMTLIEANGSGETAINSRDNQDVFDAHDCTMHATSGLFTWNIQIEDTDITNQYTAIGQKEPHLATFTFTWDGGEKQAHKEILLNVLNLRSVPQA